MLFHLPSWVYDQYNRYQGNGQSALLQALKESVKKTYSTSYLRADGQVVKVDFTDGICFEIVPGFINVDNVSFIYPDTNNNGSWRVTNPRAEIAAIKDANLKWNYNLKRLCRMARSWKDTWSVPIGGLLIDTLAYNFMNNWAYKDNSFTYYDWLTRDFFAYLKGQKSDQNYWLAPGSNQYVWRSGNFEYKATRCYNIAIEALSYEAQNQEWSANQKWRDIFGAKFSD